MNRGADWLADKVLSVSGGRIKLSGGRGSGFGTPGLNDPRDQLSPILTPSRHDILDGNEDMDTGVELQARS